MLTISSTGDKNLNLPVRQVEPSHLEIVFCEHQKAAEEPAEVLLRLVLTGGDTTGSAYTARQRFTYTPIEYK